MGWPAAMSSASASTSCAPVVHRPAGKAVPNNRVTVNASPPDGAASDSETVTLNVLPGVPS